MPQLEPGIQFVAGIVFCTGSLTILTIIPMIWRNPLYREVAPLGTVLLALITGTCMLMGAVTIRSALSRFQRRPPGRLQLAMLTAIGCAIVVGWHVAWRYLLTFAQ